MSRLNPFVGHLDPSLGGKVVVRQEITGTGNKGKRHSGLDQWVHDQIHDKAQPSIDGALGAHKLLECHEDMFAKSLDFCKIRVWR